MNEETVRGSQRFASRWACWALPVACLTMGFLSACSGGAGYDPQDEFAYEDQESDASVDSDVVQGESDTTLKKAQLASPLISATTCQKCTPKTVCEQKLVSCSPPVFVNGREIKCLEEVCREEVVCTPCGGEDDIVDFDGIDGIDLDILRQGGGFPPIDPLPSSF